MDDQALHDRALLDLQGVSIFYLSRLASVSFMMKRPTPEFNHRLFLEDDQDDYRDSWANAPLLISAPFSRRRVSFSATNEFCWNRDAPWCY